MSKTRGYKKVNSLLILFLLLITSQVVAQVYPVNVFVKMTPPYSVRLSEYTTSISERMYIDLSLLDVNDFNRKVKLKLIVKRNNQVLFTSRDFVAGAPDITLDGGIPLTLTNLDLAPYFRLENLQGISPQMYHNPLPDGYYQFCFEVYDFNTGRRFSKAGCDNVHLEQFDPPVLNLPKEDDIISAQLPQNIFFTWTPRGTPPSGVKYEFTLKELWDTQIDPRSAFQAAPPLYQTTTFDRSLLYGPVEPQLIEGKTYGWQVRAVGGNGIEETSLYKNNGYSEIFWFTYVSQCDFPAFILAEAISSSTERITWDPDPDHLNYRVQYRKVAYSEETEKERARREERNERRAKKGKDPVQYVPERVDYDWFEVNTLNPYTTIYNLEEGTTYEYRVGSQCHFMGDYSYSYPEEFTTPTREESTYYNCGISPEIVITNKDPLQNLGVNETFMAGDFPVTVKEVRGANGKYSGWGYIMVPYLADTKIRVAFDDIQINTDFQLTQGEVETSYDKDWQDVESVDEFIAGVVDLYNIVEEMLNLDIDKATREKIKELTRSFIDGVKNEDLPEELATSLIAAANEMEAKGLAVKDAEDQLEAAKASGDEEKITVATESLNSAKTQFNEAQNKLKEVNKERSEYLDQFSDIILKALTEIYREYENLKPVTSYLTQLNNFTVLEENTDESTITQEESELIMLDVDFIETSNPSQAFKEYDETLRKMGIYFISKIVIEDANEYYYEKFIEMAKANGSDLYKKAKSLLESGATENEVVPIIKEEIIKTISKILEHNG